MFLYVLLRQFPLIKHAHLPHLKGKCVIIKMLLKSLTDWITFTFHVIAENASEREHSIMC